MLLEPRDLAAKVQQAGADVATMHNPRLRYRSINAIDTDACLDWQAHLLLSVTEADDTAICVGTCEFLIVRLGEEPVSGAVLNQTSEIAVFGPLFEGAQIAGDVQAQFDGEPIRNAVLVVSAILLDPLRGNGLGAWMISRLIRRMLPGHDGLVLMYPSPLFKCEDPVQQRQAVESLTRHWGNSIGVEPILQHPHILGQHVDHLRSNEAAPPLPDQISVPLPTLEHAVTLALVD
ncbi:hypothetical protein [Nocardia abscessus]|uniref:hypothetical protein n=1 Tax=Nocardia abscessus TaxID=120957 RepID=UPI002454A545|nr:hypothetical protein [Nocardia abscessus]